MSKYWNNQGNFEAEFSTFTSELMPSSGPAETLGGELVRAANRLYYDAFNNGFCNNTSGAINYIKQYLVPHYRDNKDLLEAIALIEPKTNTNGYSSVGESTGAALDLIIDQVALFIINHEDLAASPNPCDMFDFQDEDAYYEEDEEEDENEIIWDEDDEYA